MSENLSPKVSPKTSNSSLGEWLRWATIQLKTAGSTSPRLDALLLLADQLLHDKAWILAHPEQLLDVDSLSHLSAKLDRRLGLEPLAYIRGRQEFFGRDFLVSPSVLIPRPETETLVELVLQLSLPQSARLLDVGTGSGCIAITVKLECPAMTIVATDISSAVLKIAKKNARHFGADISFLQRYLLEHLSQPVFDCIVANLPYVAPDWPRSTETNFEPQEALLAEDDGLALIKELIASSHKHLKPHGYLLLEAHPQQHQRIIGYAKDFGYIAYEVKDFILILQLQYY